MVTVPYTFCCIVIFKWKIVLSENFKPLLFAFYFNWIDGKSKKKEDRKWRNFKNWEKDWFECLNLLGSWLKYLCWKIVFSGTIILLSTGSLGVQRRVKRQTPATKAKTCSEETKYPMYMKLEGANANPFSQQNSSTLLVKVEPWFYFVSVILGMLQS